MTWIFLAVWQQFIVLQLRQIHAFVLDFAPSRVLQAQDATARRGFAATGLANKAERLALTNAEADSIDSLHQSHGLRDQNAFRHRKMHHEIGHVD